MTDQGLEVEASNETLSRFGSTLDSTQASMRPRTKGSARAETQPGSAEVPARRQLHLRVEAPLRRAPLQDLERPARTSIAEVRHSPALARDTLALVLAGGRGTRLRGLTSHRVKPAVPFGGKYRLIDFPLSNCLNSGIRRIGVLTQYKAHSLIKHLGDAWGFLRRDLNEFVEILPAQQWNGPRWYEGTADSVYQVLEVVRSHSPRLVLVLGGDHVYKMDYGAMLDFHARSGAQVTVGCIEVPLVEAGQFGVLATDPSGRVRHFEEKPKHPSAMPGAPDRALCSMGIYVFDADYLHKVLRHDSLQPDSGHDFGADLLPAAVKAMHQVFAFPFRDTNTGAQGYWRDVGTLDAYWRANLELTCNNPPLDLYDSSWPIWTHQEQMPPTRFACAGESGPGIAEDSLIAAGCVVQGASLRQSLLFPRVHVGANSRLEQCVVLPGADIGAGCRIRRAIIEAGCRLGPREVIGQDYESDRTKYYVSPDGVVLVTPEMLGQDAPGTR